MRRWWGCCAYVSLLGCTGYVVERPLPPLDAGVVHTAPPVEPAVPPQVDVAEPPQDSGSIELAITIAQGDQLADYLTDGEGRALYMFTDDVSDGDEAACVGDCALAFLPFDLALESDPPPVFASGIDAHEITRMHRQDGAWQARYKGYPLYYRAGERAGELTADGLGGTWFAARDYVAFLSITSSFEPTGTSEQRQLYLTDGFGRTLYVCLDDQPTVENEPAFSVCSGECLANRPPFAASASLRTTRLPSSLEPSVLGSFVRPDGIVQLTFRGWPLYYFGGDAAAGGTSGHNQGAWRAIDPIAFGEGKTL
jgi:predicted lipoprotein with Yx(FWY)xxD motif